MDKVHNRIQSHSHFSELISHSIFSYPFSVHDTWGQGWNSNVSRLLRPYIQIIILPIIHTYFIYLYNNTAGVYHRTLFLLTSHRNSEFGFVKSEFIVKKLLHFMAMDFFWQCNYRTKSIFPLNIPIKILDKVGQSL